MKTLHFIYIYNQLTTYRFYKQGQSQHVLRSDLEQEGGGHPVVHKSHFQPEQEVIQREAGTCRGQEGLQVIRQFTVVFIVIICLKTQWADWSSQWLSCLVCRGIPCS